MEGSSDARRQSLGREAAVPFLAAVIVDLHDDELAEPLHDAAALAVGAGSGAPGRPADLRASVRTIGVLASWPARGGEAPLELLVRNHEVVADPEIAGHGSRSCAAKARMSPPSRWGTSIAAKCPPRPNSVQRATL